MAFQHGVLKQAVAHAGWLWVLIVALAFTLAPRA